MIQSIEDLSKAISLATRRGNVLVAGYVEMLTFAYEQATQHGNSNPFTLIREAVTQFAARPSGMSRKRLDGFVRDFCGFVYDTDSQTYKLDRSIRVQELPEQGVAYWNHEVEPVEFDISQYVQRFVAKLQKEGLSDKKILDAVGHVVVNSAQKAA